MENVVEFLKSKMDAAQFDKIAALQNEKLNQFIAKAIEVGNPGSVFVATDSDEDVQYIRDLALKNNEESTLSTEGHTIHFDGFNDQARDPKVTKYLVNPDTNLGESLSQMDKAEGVAEVMGFFENCYEGKEMIVAFFCLGPVNSEFSLSAVQITDSAYVAHSETILYRVGYEQFKKLNGSGDFFRFWHTAGELAENNTSKNIDKRRIYMDLDNNIVYSTNTQYAGNTVGLKKLALRLAINKSGKEGWLAEHMFLMGVHGPNDRVTYFSGAFPSACGKTSTAMIPGQTIIGDDIAYLRKMDGKVRAANVEQGIFGIIADVNPIDDPVIYDALTTPREIIFSNVLRGNDNNPYWIGMGQDTPAEGYNYAGDWKAGDKDAKGNELSPSHKNARYTIRINELANRDAEADSAAGVELGGVVYGGRDSDTCVPVEEAKSWSDGIILKAASIESETTAATLGQEGVRKFSIMANMDFVSYPLGQYIQNNLDFGNSADQTPKVFSVNYFLKSKEGQFLTDKIDKKVWMLWAELRVHGEVDAIETPTGFIPKYEDIQRLYKEAMDKDFSEELYEELFTIRVPELLAKYRRIEAIYKEKVADTPAIVYETFDKICGELIALQEKCGDDVKPSQLA